MPLVVLPPQEERRKLSRVETPDDPAPHDNMVNDYVE
jgi:hypothetical protein